MGWKNKEQKRDGISSLIAVLQTGTKDHFMTGTQVPIVMNIFPKRKGTHTSHMRLFGIFVNDLDECPLLGSTNGFCLLYFSHSEQTFQGKNIYS